MVVHTSFRAVRPVDGGPVGLIEALGEALGPEGTLVMPTMSAGDAVFDPRTTPSVDMGVVAETFRSLPGVVRSTHPGASFAARGPHATGICAPQPLSPPHGHDSPVGRVLGLDGQVLLLGVGHSENTTLHLAEALAEVPYWQAYETVVGAGSTVQIPETDHCCRGFAMADRWLKGAQVVGRVGSAVARLVGSRALIDAVVPRLKAEPLMFLCAPELGCEECDAARASVGRPVPAVPSGKW
ncbi:MAG: AAC(3) family N-acetyltransferase [Myxococcaceae bacterium]